MNFTEIIKKLRNDRDKNQSEIAEAVGLKTNTYQAYERGVAEPKIETLCKLADFYGVSTDFLLGRVANADSKSAELEKLERIAGTLPPEDVAVLLVVAERFKAKSAPQPMQEARTLETISEAVDDAEAKKDA